LSLGRGSHFLDFLPDFGYNFWNDMKYFLATFGCQMNKSDSERIQGLLDGFGFIKTDKDEEADLIILNSCSVRQAAEDRIFGLVKNYVALKKQNPELVVAITGCMPGRDKENKFKDKMPGLDLYFPISELNEFPQRLAELRPEWTPCHSDRASRRVEESLKDCLRDPSASLHSARDDKENYFSVTPRYSSKFHAFVPIQTGCDRFCSYCAVPYARGREKCRPVKDILEEIKKLGESGCVSVELLGQVVNNYKASDPENFSKNNPYKDHFASLLWEINQISEMKRVHFTSAHPIYMNDEIIDALALRNQINYLHLAVQSGDNKILKKMNRPYTCEDYLKIIDKIRAKRPEIALGTDIIIGFSGEREVEFQNTLDLYKKADFDIAYLGIYSPRSGTVAAKNFKDDVPQEEKKKRWHRLQELMEQTALRKNQKYVGQEVEVLVDKSEHGKCSGWSREMKFVELPGDANLIGRLVKVKIEEAMEWILRGKICY
jgi:tRNA-2-methylthio-N6-dimethylallyladenosine synthase